MAQSLERVRFATLTGSFHRRQIKNKTYVYFNFRDVDGRGRAAYVGPANQRVQRLIEEFDRVKESGNQNALTQRAQACVVLGCSSATQEHFRIIRKLASYGFFRWGGVLIGAHAFAAMGIMTCL